MANYNTTSGNHTFNDEIRVDEIKDNAGTGAPLFPNGIAGITDGSSVAAGSIGEVIEVIPTGNVSVSGTEADLTGYSLVLTAGIWYLDYTLSVEIGHGAGVGDGHIRVSAIITDSSNTRIVGSGTAIAMATHPTLSTNNGYSITQTSLLNITSGDTYKLRAKTSVKLAAGGGATVYGTTLDIDGGTVFGDSFFRAIRVG